MNGITVKTLLKACEEQVEKGNGNKVVQITSDDEANAYHTLYFLFDDDKETIEMVSDLFHDNVDTDNVVLLG